MDTATREDLTMTDDARAARDDLAFLKAVVDDRGPLPALLGWHLLLVGCAFAPNLTLVWAIFAGHVAWPAAWIGLTWLPGVALWLPGHLWLQRTSGRSTLGPSAQVFGAAWAAMGLMTVVTVALLVTAEFAGGLPVMSLWPALGFVLWGGAWSVVAINRRQPWVWGVALGSFAVAITCGVVVGRPEVWLVAAAGLMLSFAAPGLVIVRAARAR